MQKVPGTLLVILALVLGIAATARAQDSTQFAYSQCSANLEYYEVDCRIGTYPASYAYAAGWAPHWSPDGTSVVLYDANYGYIAVVSAVNGTETYLSTAYTWDEQPVWGRDGRIAFVSYRNGQPAELYVMNGDGSNQTRVTNNAGFLGYTGSWAWSPDNSRFAFVANQNYEQGLWIINTDGTGLRQVTTPIGISRAPVWSADGQRLAFECSADLRPDICVINADGTNFQRLTTDPGNDTNPAFSADGSLAFTTEMFGAGSEIAVMDSAGTITRLTPGTGGDHAVWSPDGTKLLFVGTIASFNTGICYDDAAHNADDFCVSVYPIYVVNADGTGLTHLADGDSPDWRPITHHPVASFSAWCTDDTCTFDATSSVEINGAIASYSWNFGDGTTATGATASHTYSVGAYYSVTLTVADTAGVTDSRTDVVLANRAPVASFTVSCSGLTCTFNGGASSDPDGSVTAYTWYFGDGQSGAGAGATHTYASLGTYQIYLTVGDNAGATTTRTQSIAVSQPGMHIGDLSRSANVQNNSWTSLVFVTVHKPDHTVLGNAHVIGSWSDGTVSDCWTSMAGQCTVAEGSLSKSVRSVSFTVKSITASFYEYTAAANHDPDGNSNGTTIVVSR